MRVLTEMSTMYSQKYLRVFTNVFVRTYIFELTKIRSRFYSGKSLGESSFGYIFVGKEGKIKF